MTTFYGMLRLAGPDQWKGLAGEDKWKPTRSAYELAYAWHGANGIPRGIVDAFNRSGIPGLAGLRLEIGFVEKPTFLDTPLGPSMTDIMGYARNRGGDPVILAVEGKATESFGLPVRSWVRGDVAQPADSVLPRESRLRRLRYLANRLGIPADENSPLYYQLLHRTVSALTEAALSGSALAVLVVHSFAAESHDNWHAYVSFLEALGIAHTEKGMVAGPASLRPNCGVQLYTLWFADKPRESVT